LLPLHEALLIWGPRYRHERFEAQKRHRPCRDRRQEDGTQRSRWLLTRILRGDFPCHGDPSPTSAPNCPSVSRPSRSRAHSCSTSMSTARNGSTTPSTISARGTSTSL